MLDTDATTALLELVGDDPEALAEIVDAFVEEGPQRLAELRDGIARGDATLIGRAAHTLKANARTFGATQLALLGEEIETAARSGDLTPASACIDQLEEEWRAVQPALGALRAGATA
jgi:HPt (histidine-containing phosphotransfer) domain-containing protein